MAIQHDNQGFLVGDLVEGSKNLLAGQGTTNRLLGGIKTDVSAIARALGVASRGGRSSGGSHPVAEPAGRGNSARGGAVGARSPGSASMSAQRTGGFGVANARATVAPGGRDSRGRFVAGAGGAGKPGGVEGGGGGRLLDKLGSVADALKGMAGGGEQVDPALTALKEVKDVVAPLGRGAFALLGRSSAQKKESWYQKIWKSLTNIEKKPVGGSSGGMSTSDTGGGSSGFFSSLFGSMLGGKGKALAGGVAGGGLLSSIFGRSKGIAGAAAAGETGVAGAAAGLASKAGLLGKAGGALKGAGGLLKRIPILGALIAGGGALASMFGSDDPSKSADENRTEKYKGVGGSLGMVGGGMLGAAVGSLAGPVGTVVGGYLGSMGGEIIGEKVGEWTKTLVDSDIPGQMSKTWAITTAAMGAAWDSFATDTKSVWTETASKASEWWDSAKTAAEKVGTTLADAGNALNDFVKAKTGVDVKGAVTEHVEKMTEGAKSLYSDTKDAVGNAWDKAKGWAGDAGGAVADAAVTAGSAMVPNTIKRAYRAGDAAATQAKAGYDVARGTPTDSPAPSGAVQSLARGAGGAVGKGANWVLGQTSQQYESGKGGAGTVSTGKGDNGGASYGTYQLSSKMGTVDKFLGKSGYASQFEGLKPGSPEFDAKWKDVAKSDPAFGGAQHDFIKETHFDPAMAGLKKGGIDLSGRGSAVQDSLWSTSVQFGAGEDKGKKGAVPMFQKALAGKDVSKMSDPEIVSAIQDYKLANNDALFKNSSEGVRSSTANRASSEKTALLGLNATTQVASAPSYVAQAIPSSVPTKLPSTPEVNIPAPSTEKERPLAVSIRQPIGQDMGDRSIAHIVSGGMGG